VRRVTAKASDFRVLQPEWNGQFAEADFIAVELSYVFCACVSPMQPLKSVRWTRQRGPTLSFRRDRLRAGVFGSALHSRRGLNSIARQMQQPRGGMRSCEGPSSPAYDNRRSARAMPVLPSNNEFYLAISNNAS
jgi:hypothetical protein